MFDNLFVHWGRKLTPPAMTQSDTKLNRLLFEKNSFSSLYNTCSLMYFPTDLLIYVDSLFFFFLLILKCIENKTRLTTILIRNYDCLLASDRQRQTYMKSIVLNPKMLLVNSKKQKIVEDLREVIGYNWNRIGKKKEKAFYFRVYRPRKCLRKDVLQSIAKLRQ